MPQSLLPLLPKKPGVYIFKNAKGKVIYVGKASNLQNRVKSYFSSLGLGEKTRVLVSQIKKVDHIIVESEFEALLLEAELIKKFQPKYNSRLKDDKSFLYIKITDEEWPKVFPARKAEGGYGPFPWASIVRQILRQIRPIFPYCSSKNPKKSCLYITLGLCPNPHFGRISKKEYRRTISNIRKLLEGKSDKLLKHLSFQMRKCAEAQMFEKAALVRDQIARIHWLIAPRHLPAEYLSNPNLVEDLRKQEIQDLTERLAVYFPDLSLLTKIEAYDISDISGRKATGSMVVFVNGEMEKSEYRKFRIKTIDRPNDVAMMQEVITRRLNHPEWGLPALILVDGGKAQVGAAMQVLKDRDLEIPVIGLTKRWEKVVIHYKQKWEVLKFEDKSPALNLLKRIRNEAHRFAHAYHQRLRTNLH